MCDRTAPTPSAMSEADSLHHADAVLSKTHNVLCSLDTQRYEIADEYTDAFNISAVGHSVHDDIDTVISPTAHSEHHAQQAKSDTFEVGSDKENVPASTNTQQEQRVDVDTSKKSLSLGPSPLNRSAAEFTQRYKTSSMHSTLPYSSIPLSTRQFSYNSIPVTTRNRSLSNTWTSKFAVTQPLQPDVLNMSQTYDVVSTPVVPSYDNLYNTISQFKHKLRSDFDASIMQLNKQLKQNRADLQQHTIQLIDNIELTFNHKIKNVMAEYNTIQLEYKQYVKNELYQLTRTVNECKHTYDSKYIELNNKYALLDKLYAQAPKPAQSTEVSLSKQYDLSTVYKELDTVKHNLQQSLAQYVQSTETRLIDINTHILELRKIIETILNNEQLTLQTRDKALNDEMTKLRHFVQSEIDSMLSNTYTLIKSLKRQLDDRDTLINKLTESVDQLKLERTYGISSVNTSASSVDSASVQHLLQRISTVENKQAHVLDDSVIAQLTQQIHTAISSKIVEQTQQREAEWSKQWEKQQLEIASLRQALIRAGVAVDSNSEVDVNKQLLDVKATVADVSKRVSSIDSGYTADMQRTNTLLSELKQAQAQLQQQLSQLQSNVTQLSTEHAGTANDVKQCSATTVQLSDKLSAVDTASTQALTNSQQAHTAIEQLQSTTTQHHTAIQDMQQFIETAKHTVEQHDNKLQQLDERIDAHGQTVVAVNRRIDTLNTSSIPSDATTVLPAALTDVHQQLQQHSAELAQLAVQLKEHQTAALNLTAINESHVDSITDKLNTTSEQYQAALKQHSLTVQQLQTTVMQLQQRVDEVAAQHTDAIKQHSDSVTAQLTQLTTQPAATPTAAVAELLSGSSVETLTMQITDLQLQLTSLQQQIESAGKQHAAALTEHVDDTDHKLTALSNRVDAVDIAHTDYKKANDTALAQLKQLPNTPASTVRSTSDTVSSMQIDILTKHLNSLQTDLTKCQQQVQQHTQSTSKSLTDVHTNIAELSTEQQVQHKTVQALEATLTALHADVDTNYEHTQQGFSQTVIDLQSLTDKVHTLQQVIQHVETEFEVLTSSQLPNQSPTMAYTKVQSPVKSEHFAKPVALSRKNSTANQHVAVAAATQHTVPASPAAKQAQAAQAQRMIDLSDDASKHNHIQFDTIAEPSRALSQSQQLNMSMSSAQLPPLHIRDGSADYSMFNMHSPINAVQNTLPSIEPTPVKRVDSTAQSNNVHSFHNSTVSSVQHNNTVEQVKAEVQPAAKRAVVDTDLSLSMNDSNPSHDLSEFTFGSPAPVKHTVAKPASTAAPQPAAATVKPATPNKSSMFAAFGVADDEPAATQPVAVRTKSIPPPLPANYQLTVNTAHAAPAKTEIKTPTFNNAAANSNGTSKSVLNSTAQPAQTIIQQTKPYVAKKDDVSVSEQFVSELDDFDFSIADADLSYKD